MIARALVKIFLVDGAPILAGEIFEMNAWAEKVMPKEWYKAIKPENRMKNANRD